MSDLKQYIRNVPDFPSRGILFRDIAPLLRDHFDAAINVMEGLLDAHEWQELDAVAGIESRGFILGAALAARRGKGFVLVRKKGKLPPPVVDLSYSLEYGTGTLEMQRGNGRLLLVDDVLATGGTLSAAADLCERAGYQIKSLAVLIDLHIVANYRWRTMPARASINY